MTCEKAMSLISAYLDKELGFDEFRQVELHLGGCEACSRECEAVRATKELLGTLKAAELPEDFWPELREKLGVAAAGKGAAASATAVAAPEAQPLTTSATSRCPRPALRGAWWRRVGRDEPGSSYRGLFSASMMRMFVPALLVLALAVLPVIWNAYRRPAEAGLSSGLDSIEPYFRDYVISEYDRPLSDKTSVGFVVTGQAVTMYASDLLEPSSLETPSETTYAGSLERVLSSPPSSQDLAGGGYTLTSYPNPR